MSFKQLYALRQGLPEYVTRTDILSAVKRIAGCEIFLYLSGKITTDTARGFYLPPGANLDRIPVYAHGKHVICLARDNNRCWARLVAIKEAMHVFDSPLEWTATADELENLIGEFVVSDPTETSAQMLSENRALWMALSMFCREVDRVKYANLLANQSITPKQVSEILHMPLQHVPHLFGPKYKSVIESILRP